MCWTASASSGEETRLPRWSTASSEALLVLLDKGRSYPDDYEQDEWEGPKVRPLITISQRVGEAGNDPMKLVQHLRGVLDSAVR